MRCLSGVRECDEICDICRKAYEDYVERTVVEETEKAIRILSNLGWTLIPPIQHGQAGHE